MSRVFVLAAYVLLFSVQICFRYTTANSVDLDQYSSSFTKASVHNTAPSAFFHGGTRRNTTHSILNKRYQPVDIMATRVVEFTLGYSPNVVRPVLYPKSEPIATRASHAALLRGPPVSIC